MSRIDLDLLKLNRPAPRYTSYPTAPEWEVLPPTIYQEKLEELSKCDVPLSLYVHIPFCKTMCLYCGCSVVLNRKPENETLYVDYLCREIDLVSQYLGSKKRVVQLHFGGGTPTKLSIPLMTQLMDKLDTTFMVDYKKEISIEIDPRTVIEDGGKKLRFLRNTGFNRVSFGVQDTDPHVQRAVRRDQSLEMTFNTFRHARELGFKGINVDLIYGLPFQTVESFHQTIHHILKMEPDRISLFSYANIPWLKPHQKAIKAESLPSTEVKFQIYARTREQLVQHGYVAIGMDHFAKEEDELSHAYHHKTLQRNFQGYSVKLAEEHLGFGITSIGYMQGMYVQNIKELPHYYTALDRNLLPILKGKVLSEEDLLRKWVIHTLMCDFEIHKSSFQERFGIAFDHHFNAILERLLSLEHEGLVINTPKKLVVTRLGELFVRIIAMAFDAYQSIPPTPKFSQSI